MKIGFVLDDTLDSTDGVQQYVLTLGGWLSQQGHEVHYLVGQTNRTDLQRIHSLSRNVGVTFNGNRLSIPLPASREAIKQLLQREQFDVLHVQLPYSPFLAGRIIMAAPATTRLIGTFHIYPQSKLVRFASRLLRLYERRSLRRFHAVVSVSRAAQQFAAQAFNLKTNVLPNVVDVARFAAADAPASPGRTIAYLGRLVPRKGCQTLLTAMVQLRKDASFNDVRLTVYGRGPLEAELKRYAIQHGLQDAVTFAGYVSEADKPAAIKAADVAVFPSNGGESFGIVLVEAMATARPVVIGADNDGYRTVLEGHKNLLFPPDDSVALAERLKMMLQDDAARQAALLWQAGAVTQYDVAVVGAKVLELYGQS